MSDPTREEAAAYRSAAQTTLEALQRAIESRMEEVASAFWGLETKAATRAPIVRGGWLPPKTSDEEFPFLIVRPSNGTDDADASGAAASATFEILIGTYRDTDDGWRDLLAVIDAIRLNLGGGPNLGGAFQHAGPLAWAIPSEQPRPQWVATVTLQFQLPRPVRVEARNPTEE